jgi:hypothetical protein
LREDEEVSGGKKDLPKKVDSTTVTSNQINLIDKKSNLAHSSTKNFDKDNSSSPVKSQLPGSAQGTKMGSETKMERFEEVRIVTKNGFVYRREVLCRTISGMRVPLITVTSKRGKGLLPIHKRKAIVVSSRVHPGESNASCVF